MKKIRKERKMKTKLPLPLQIFLSMLKIGAFTFGGGYAMIALMEREFTENRKWISKEEFLDLVAIAESTPGPIAINSATYIGYKVLKVPGSILATVGIVLPSFTILYLISLFFDAFLSLTFVQYAFRGIRVCVIFLIGKAGIKFFMGLKKDWLTILLFILSTLAILFSTLFTSGISSIVLILISGGIGILAGMIRSRKGGAV